MYMYVQLYITVLLMFLGMFSIQTIKNIFMIEKLMENIGGNWECFSPLFLLAYIQCHPKVTGHPHLPPMLTYSFLLNNIGTSKFGMNLKILMCLREWLCMSLYCLKHSQVPPCWIFIEMLYVAKVVSFVYHCDKIKIFLNYSTWWHLAVFQTVLTHAQLFFYTH